MVAPHLGVHGVLKRAFVCTGRKLGLYKSPLDAQLWMETSQERRCPQPTTPGVVDAAKPRCWARKR